MTGPDPEVNALDNAEQAIVDGKEQVAEQREAALSAADSAAERDAINTRFDGLESRIDGLHDQLATTVNQSTEGIAGQFQALDAKLNQILAAGNSSAGGDDDGILSIEEIADDMAGDVQDAASAAGDAAGAVAEQVDKAPARGHRLFRKMWGG